VTYSLTIVCLANSRKMSGRCIAGKEWSNNRAGKWVRPISIRETHEISETDRQYQDGVDPAVLDIITIPFKNPAASDHQPENHLIDDGRYWTKIGVVSISTITPFADRPSTLWTRGFDSGSGTNDRVPIGEVSVRAGSLYLVEVANLIIQVEQVTGPSFSKRVVRAKFDYHNESYDLRVTDPLIERAYFAQPDGQHVLGPALLCVSLSDPFNGYYYKLAASILCRRGRP
jgi:hypothetical protein